MSKKYLIAVDDGHGMETAGKCTPPLKTDLVLRGKVHKKGTIIHENDFNEGIMEYFIEGCKRCGIDTLQVAPGDKDVPLSTRVKTANVKNADLYLSFHANALAGLAWQTKAYGLVVIKHYECQNKTTKLANNIYKHLKDEVNWYKDGGSKYGVRKDKDISGFSLYVLNKTIMPAVLVEYGFMDNWQDVKVMVTEQFQKQCAESTLKGVCETLGIEYIKEKQQYLRVTKNVNLHNKPDFNKSSVCGKATNGTVLTIVEKIKREGTDMYKTKAGTYITSSPKYIEVFEK